MKLALVGVVVLAIGLALSIPGLVAAGGLWIVTGPLARAYGRRFAADAEERTADRRDYVLGTLILLAIGLPSLALGLFEVGFPEDERGWRFVPIAVGGLITAFAVLSGGLMLVGSGLLATADAIGIPERRASVAIRSVGAETATVSPIGDGDPSERLAQLERMRSAGQITDEEFERHRRRILDSI